MIMIRFIKICMLLRIFSALMCSCTSRLDFSVSVALSLSGSNRSELEQVLEYYKDDSLKLKAAEFLISNMIGKGSLTYTFYNPKEENLLDTVHFNDYTDLESIVRNGHFSQNDFKADLQFITASFLIKNIDLAFHVREKYSWCKNLSFYEFCQSILPYRIIDEPLEDWRSLYYDKYAMLVDSLVIKGYSMKDIVFHLNSALQKKYVPEAGNIPGYFSAKLIEHIGGGTCEQLALNATQIMRSFGIPLQLPYSVPDSGMLASYSIGIYERIR